MASAARTCPAPEDADSTSTLLNMHAGEIAYVNCQWSVVSHCGPADTRSDCAIVIAEGSKDTNITRPKRSLTIRFMFPPSFSCNGMSNIAPANGRLPG